MEQEGGMEGVAALHYRVTGEADAPPWVFLHGLMGAGQNWRRIVRGMQQGRQILTYDQRGHGRSAKPAQGYALEDYANDLLMLVDALGWSRFVLVGHSLGGRVALCFAHAYPQRLRGLVIVDIGPGGQNQIADRSAKLLEMIPTPFADKAAAKHYFAHTFAQQAHAAGWGAVARLGAFLYSNLHVSEQGQVDWRFYKPGMLASVAAPAQQPRWDQLHGLSMPTLLMRGEHSDYLSPETFRQMVACNAHIQGVQIPQAGHWVHADQPEAFMAQLHHFEQRLSGG
ncbi:alpha/beta hydrolase fold protein [Magnetococcus marinus MC-1]|uniref:Alpha/beta hydrolase fold protein n=1 Tax=Magnetococcus marinus (strain ATCC BAA-1437 / JCM 17883 / MC-1) TaxID=156889 RepID=A0LBW2_MAGMM|nr:alpha/beta hydrolase [Magnetococcus marinus]ABK45455.1 alpha/beta hydrolase fold protein [Magnetococcus marinus MC-1]